MNSYFKTIYDNQIFEVSENYVAIIVTEKKELERFKKIFETSELVQKLDTKEIENLQQILSNKTIEPQNLFGYENTQINRKTRAKTS